MGSSCSRLSRRQLHSFADMSSFTLLWDKHNPELQPKRLLVEVIYVKTALQAAPVSAPLQGLAGRSARPGSEVYLARLACPLSGSVGNA